MDEYGFWPEDQNVFFRSLMNFARDSKKGVSSLDTEWLTRDITKDEVL